MLLPSREMLPRFIYVSEEHDSELARWLGRLRHLLPELTKVGAPESSRRKEETNSPVPSSISNLWGGHSTYPKKLKRSIDALYPLFPLWPQ